MVDMLAFYSDDSSSTRAKKNSSKFIKIWNENQVTPLVLYIKKIFNLVTLFQLICHQSQLKAIDLIPFQNTFRNWPTLQDDSSTKHISTFPSVDANPKAQVHLRFFQNY